MAPFGWVCGAFVHWGAGGGGGGGDKTLIRNRHGQSSWWLCRMVQSAKGRLYYEICWNVLIHVHRLVNY
jgi:hypothetical protein